MKALKFEKHAAQGEIYLTRLGPVGQVAIPAGKPLALENGSFIIGHSETGHHHVLERTAGVKVIEADSAPEGMKLLYIALDEANQLVHKRDFDTHQALGLEAGTVYEARLSREFDPYAEKARQSMD